MCLMYNKHLFECLLFISSLHIVYFMNIFCFFKYIYYIVCIWTQRKLRETCVLETLHLHIKSFYKYTTFKKFTHTHFLKFWLSED